MYADIQHELDNYIKLANNESIHEVIKKNGLGKYKKTDPTFVKEIKEEQVTVMSKSLKRIRKR